MIRKILSALLVSSTILFLNGCGYANTPVNSPYIGGGYNNPGYGYGNGGYGYTDPTYGTGTGYGNGGYSDPYGYGTGAGYGSGYGTGYGSGYGSGYGTGYGNGGYNTYNANSKNPATAQEKPKASTF